MKQTKHDKNSPQWFLAIIAACLVALVCVFILTNLSAFSGVVKGLLRVFSSILYGVLFAYLLNPLVKFVDKRLFPFMLRRGIKEKIAHRVSRVSGLVFAFAVAAFMIYALIYMVAPQLGNSIVGILSSMPDYYQSVEGWVLNVLEDNPTIKDYVDSALQNGYAFLESFLKNDLMGRVQAAMISVTSSVYALIREALNMLIGIVVSVYILLSKDKFLAQTKKMVVAFFKPETADRVMEHGRQIDRIFNGFIIGKLIDSLIIGILCYIGVAILKMPHAVLVATIVGVTNVIPYFGPFMGAIPCALLILLVDPVKCFYFIIFIFILQQLDGNVIGPRILGENVGISGFWILVSITVASGLFGFMGMLLGVPVFAVIYMMVSDAVNRALERKQQSTKTSDYVAIRTVADLPNPESAEDERAQQQGQQPET